VKVVVFMLIVMYEPFGIVLGGTIGQRVMMIKVVKASYYKANDEQKNINLFNSIMIHR